MVDAPSSESPLDAVADRIGEETTEAFEILGNDTRLAILLVLWDAQDPSQPFSESSEAAVSFSELRERVGMRDSGQFNYHLDKLAGLFVERTENGYVLASRAESILHTMLAGTLDEYSSFEGEPIDAACFRCGGATVIDYDDRRLTVRCTNCDGMWRSSDTPSGTVVTVGRPPVG